MAENRKRKSAGPKQAAIMAGAFFLFLAFVLATIWTGDWRYLLSAPLIFLALAGAAYLVKDGRDNGRR